MNIIDKLKLPIEIVKTDMDHSVPFEAVLIVNQHADRELTESFLARKFSHLICKSDIVKEIDALLDNRPSFLSIDPTIVADFLIDGLEQLKKRLEE